MHFLHPCVGSACVKSDGNDTKLNNTIQPGGSSVDCIARSTCFAHGMSGDYEDKQASYSNFRFYSETLLASVLAPEYEQGIVDYRESHSGMVMGMTRRHTIAQ